MSAVTVATHMQSLNTCSIPLSCGMAMRCRPKACQATPHRAAPTLARTRTHHPRNLPRLGNLAATRARKGQSGLLVRSHLRLLLPGTGRTDNRQRPTHLIGWAAAEGRLQSLPAAQLKICPTASAGNNPVVDRLTQIWRSATLKDKLQKSLVSVLPFSKLASNKPGLRGRILKSHRF